MDLHLKFRKFTIFIGPNSSGKSSILQSMLILKNSLKNDQPSQIALRRDAYDYGAFSDIVTFGLDGNVSIAFNGNLILDQRFADAYEQQAIFNYKLTFNKTGTIGVDFYFRIQDYELEFFWENDQDVRVNFQDIHTKKQYQISRYTLNGIHPNLTLNGSDELARSFNRLFQNGTLTKQLMDDFHYVPFFRTATKYSTKLTRFQLDVLESKPEELMSAIFSNLSKDTKLLDKVSLFMKELTGKTVRTRNVDLQFDINQTPGVTLDFIRNNFSNSVINEGTGPNQAILLLYAMLGTKPHSVIAIDEPELHLHPKAQSQLAKIMIDISAKDSKQIIFATHSEYMIYPFLNSIANKKNGLTLNDVAIYYFDLDEKRNLSKIEPLPINEHGQITGGLKGFWDADLEIISEYESDKNE